MKLSPRSVHLLKIGDVFGRLEIKGFDFSVEPGNKYNRRRKYAICQCSCGNSKRLRASNLTHLNTRSCGCLRIESGKRRKLVGYKEICPSWFNDFERNAKLRNIPFLITMQDVWEVWERQGFKCNLTGIHLLWGQRIKGAPEGTASIDRIDNSKYYTKDNIQIINKHINLMKLDHSQQEFIKLCRLVAEHTKGLSFPE